MTCLSHARYLLLALIVIPAVFTFAQFDDTDGATRPTDSVTANNLVLAGKVWGYLKYRHPLITKGCLDWDQELIAELPTLVNAQSLDQGQRWITQWIDGISERAVCEDEDDSDIHLESSTGWTNDNTLVGADLAAILNSLDTSPLPAKQHYVRLQPGVGNPIFDNEFDYADLDDIDWRYRVLALFRFWNIIEYWFPYRDLLDFDWDDVLEHSVPAFLKAEERSAYELELLRLVAKISDGHANLWNSGGFRPPVGTGTVPFAIRIVEGKPYVWRRLSPRDATSSGFIGFPGQGLNVGDVVLAVDGLPFEQIFEELWPYYGASNETSKMRQISQTFLYGDEGLITLSVDRDSVPIDIEVRRVPKRSIGSREDFWNDRPGETFQLLSDDISYLKLSSIQIESIPDYLEKARHSKGLIIDIRSYPGEFVVFALGQHLMSETTSFARFTAVDLSNPGLFRWTDSVSIQPAEPFFDGKVVVLVDDSSLSQAEYTAMAFRAAPDAIVVGSQTAGADGNVSRVPLPGGYVAGMSGIGVFYPDKTPTQRIGIVPDITVEPTIEGLRAGRDEVLEEAIRQIVAGTLTEQDVRNLAAIPDNQPVDNP